ncbi:hypothetical protein UF75_4457 [Desulfosporosinus sp. I2]|uniref:DUF6262 family protein n=1 Tax=Desulfosporosinus sp. I2 TaxID=1617025 RepID=UPI0005EEB4BC|nr:DUF6262 family protein [Desulfosporosinus sp. I2]KJR45152.1 hypothetical protein UF75_4457 [Desulfosporosinus sp. I2]
MRNSNTQKALEKVYEGKRAATLEKIKTAIQDIRSTGEKLTISQLCKLTGLSNAVFYKPHVQAILINEPEWRKTTSTRSSISSNEVLEKSNAELLKQLEMEKSKKQDLEIALERKNNRIKKYESEIAEKDTELELLRGKYHSLLTRIDQLRGLEGLEINII